MSSPPYYNVSRVSDSGGTLFVRPLIASLLTVDCSAQSDVMCVPLTDSVDPTGKLRKNLSRADSAPADMLPADSHPPFVKQELQRMQEHAASQPLSSSGGEADSWSASPVAAVNASARSDKLDDVDDVADYQSLFARIDLALGRNDQQPCGNLSSHQQQQRQSALMEVHAGSEGLQAQPTSASQRPAAQALNEQPVSKRARCASQPSCPAHQRFDVQHRVTATAVTAQLRHLNINETHHASVSLTQAGSSGTSGVRPLVAPPADDADEQMDELRGCGLLS